MGGAWRTISVALRADASGYLGPVGAAAAATRKLGDEVDSSTKRSASGWTSFSKVVQGGAAAIVLAVGAFIGASIAAAAQFEQRMSGIAAVSGATAGQMDQLRGKALQLGADTAFSAGEAALAMEELVKAGVPVEGVLNGAADATVALAAAGGVALPEAAAIAANAMNQFGLSAQDLPHVADLIAGAANASAIDVSDFGMSMSQAGAVAKLTGLSFDDTALAITAMGNAGIKGSDAGTSLKTFLTRLVPTSVAATNEMEKLGIITADGANQFFDASGKVKSLAEISDVLGTSLQGMGNQQKIAALQTVFGSDAIRAAAVIAGEGAAGFQKLNDTMQSSNATEIAAIRMHNLKGSVEQFTGSLETMLIKSGSKFLPFLTSAADGATGLVNALSSGKFDGSILAPLADAAQRLAPAWRDLRDVGVDLAKIFTDAYHAAEPIASLFARLVAGATIVGLNTMAEALSKMTGFLAANEGAVRFLVTALFALGAVKVFEFLAGGALTFGAHIMSTGAKVLQSGIATNLGMIGQGFGNMAAAGGQAFTNLDNYTGRFSAGVGQVKAGISGIAEGIASAVSPATIAFGGLTVALMLYASNQADLASKTAASKARLDELVSSAKTGEKTLKEAFDTQVLEKWAKEGDKYLSGSMMQVGIRSFTDFRSVVTATDADYQRWLQSVANSTGYDVGSASLDLLTAGVSTARGEFAGAGEQLGRYKQGQSELAGQTSAALGPQAQQIAATTEQAVAFEDLKKRTDEARDSIRKFYGGITDTLTAQVSAEGAVRALAQSFKDNGNSLDVATEAGGKNVSALVAGKDAAVEYATALSQSSGSAAQGATALQGYAARLGETMRQSGLTQGQVQFMLSTMGLTPAQITTQFNQLNLAAGTVQVDAYGNKLAGLPAVKSTAVLVDASGAEVVLSDVSRGRIAQVIAKAVTDNADIDLATVAGRLRIATIVADAITGQAEFGLAGVTDKGRVATIIAQALASGADIDLNTVAGRQRIAQIIARADTGGAEGALDNAARTRYMDIVARVQVDKYSIPEMGIAQNYRGPAGRWGAVTAYAAGGVTPAHITRNELFKYGEPETGGEAFIPKKGNKDRSMLILATAAAWYGSKVVPMARGGVVAQPVGYMTQADANAMYAGSVNDHVDWQRSELFATRSSLADAKAQSMSTMPAWSSTGRGGGGQTSVSMPLSLSVTVTGNGDKAIGDAVAAQLVPVMERNVDKVAKILVQRADAVGRY